MGNLTSKRPNLNLKKIGDSNYIDGEKLRKMDPFGNDGHIPMPNDDQKCAPPFPQLSGATANKGCPNVYLHLCPP